MHLPHFAQAEAFTGSDAYWAASRLSNALFTRAMSIPAAQGRQWPQ